VDHLGVCIAQQVKALDRATVRSTGSFSCFTPARTLWTIHSRETTNGVIGHQQIPVLHVTKTNTFINSFPTLFVLLVFAQIALCSVVHR
jgi:hypothetical protein